MLDVTMVVDVTMVMVDTMVINDIMDHSGRQQQGCWQHYGKGRHLCGGWHLFGGQHHFDGQHDSGGLQERWWTIPCIILLSYDCFPFSSPFFNNTETFPFSHCITLFQYKRAVQGCVSAVACFGRDGQLVMSAMTVKQCCSRPSEGVPYLFLLSLHTHK